MIRILIAENDEALRILLTEELQEEGYEVVATPPDRLWERLETENPSLVLMGPDARTHLQLSCLMEKGLPMLFYGRAFEGTTEPLRSAGSGVIDEAFDLKRIKSRTRELLGRPASTGRPSTGPTASRDIPCTQLGFDFIRKGE